MALNKCVMMSLHRLFLQYSTLTMTLLTKSLLFKSCMTMTWAVMVIQLSKWTPRLRMVSAGWTSGSPRAKVLPSSRWRRRRVVHHRNSYFDRLNLRLLDVVRYEMRSIHSSTLCFSSAVCDGSQKSKAVYRLHCSGGGSHALL